MMIGLSRHLLRGQLLVSASPFIVCCVCYSCWDFVIYLPQTHRTEELKSTRSWGDWAVEQRSEEKTCVSPRKWKCHQCWSQTRVGHGWRNSEDSFQLVRMKRWTRTCCHRSSRIQRFLSFLSLEAPVSFMLLLRLMNSQTLLSTVSQLPNCIFLLLLLSYWTILYFCAMF